MIKIVPFATEHLELIFKDERLYLIDYHRLVNEKFILQIYELVNEQKAKLPDCFQLNPEPAWLY